MKSIEIIINPQGQTQMQTKGFTGGNCRDATKLLEQALGEKSAEQMTAEFYQTQPVQETHRTKT